LLFSVWKLNDERGFAQPSGTKQSECGGVSGFRITPAACSRSARRFAVRGVNAAPMESPAAIPGRT